MSGKNIKRYDYGYTDDGFGGQRYLGLIEKSDGKLVLAADYDALAAEVRRQMSIADASQEKEQLAQSERIKLAIRVAEIEVELQALKAEHQWIPMTERIPDAPHKTEFLIRFADGRTIVDEWIEDADEGWCFWYGYPTHWMPLPAAPQEGTSSELCDTNTNALCRLNAGQPQQGEPEWPKEQCPVTGAVHDVDPVDLAATHSEDGREPDAWRMFDGEGNYEYTDCEETAEHWRKYLGGGYANWLNPLYLDAQPARQVVVLPKSELWQCQNTDNGNLVYLPYKPQGPWDVVEYVRRDSIARLNRPTVPLELLERIPHEWNCETFGGLRRAMDELRAILEGYTS